ncbi:Acetyltransferase (GNAT) family protein [Paenibacillus sp. yr247]|uniref:GNAT family N-acetyltransferase n=1 Tax=Paenibacillus sp. yr247 TaxID=1761880 RepID=UPI000887FC92|nr:GNAT family N-acetyltransferase [Paenibacillus sp. yr247]SDN73320.1 Acetyltransferase (GNAT) family protein [Paenibacillus sp. yr247]
MSLEIKLVDHTDPILLGLIAKLDQDLLERYPVEEIHFVDFSDPSVENITFAVAFEDNVPVGCGALRPIDKESTELKRFFVDHFYRKQGIATQLLSFLEKHAEKRGNRIIRLETGAPQPEAIALYTKYGYYPIDCFGEYIGSKGSLCFEKKIAAM